jgi:hypothetical protein
MCKLFMAMAVATTMMIAATGSTAFAQSDCDAQKPADFYTVPQQGLYGSWVVHIYTGGQTELCAHLFVRQDRSMFWSTGAEHLGGRIIRPGDKGEEAKDLQIHSTGFMFHPNSRAVIAFFATLHDKDVMAGQLINPIEKRGLQMTAKRAVQGKQ